jgi:hypothetical protein
MGNATTTVATFAAALAVMLTVNATGLLRVPEQGGTCGLEVHEQGNSAYPVYAISALGAPGGMSQEFPWARSEASVRDPLLPWTGKSGWVEPASSGEGVCGSALATTRSDERNR